MNPLPPSQSAASRRRFLGTATAALLAAAEVRQAVAQPEGTEVDEVLEPVRTAIVGTGGRGCDLLRQLTTIRGVEMVAVVDDYAPHRERGLKYAGANVKEYDDFRRMLEEIRPQAVVTAVPLFEHYRVCEAAVAAGCAVFCEKTMCFTLDEARRLVKQVKEKGCVFQVGLQRRANPIYAQAVALVQAGILGQISTIKAQWHRNNNWRRPIPVPPAHPTWAELERRLNWRLYSKYSAGLPAELGSHQMDVANRILGTHPKRVFATGGVDYWRDGRDIPDNVFCTYEYELPVRERPADVPGATAATAGPADAAAPATYGVRVTYSSICNNAYEGASELVEGSKGTLFLSSEKGLLYRERLPDAPTWGRAGDSKNADLLTAGKSLKLSNSPWAHRGDPLEIDLLQADDTRDELVSFIDHVRRRDPRTLCDVDIGYEDTATVLMAVESLRTGRPVDYPELELG